MKKLLLILAIFSNYALAVGPVNIKKSGPSKQHSEISIYPGIGYGSSGNKIRRFTAANLIKIGDALTYTADSTNGDYFTILEDGAYGVSWTDRGAGGINLGISKNSNQLTTEIGAITAAHILVAAQAAAGQYTNIGTTFIGRAGDIIRVHDNGASTGGDLMAKFRITQLSKF